MHPKVTAQTVRKRKVTRAEMAQGVGNLLVGKSLALHGPLLPLRRSSEVQVSPVLNRPEIGDRVRGTSGIDPLLAPVPGGSRQA
jgi:hypothetical protein